MSSMCVQRFTVFEEGGWGVGVGVGVGVGGCGWVGVGGCGWVGVGGCGWAGGWGGVCVWTWTTRPFDLRPQNCSSATYFTKCMASH